MKFIPPSLKRSADELNDDTDDEGVSDGEEENRDSSPNTPRTPGSKRIRELKIVSTLKDVSKFI